jgi:hypothetical protein
MPRHVAHGSAVILMIAALAGATPAGAVVKGTASSLGRYTVRLAGNGYCSGVAIARRAVATAWHCARGMYVMAAGRTFRVAGISRSAMLDDGRHVSVTGDAAILRLASPLPLSIDAAPVGEGDGDNFIIAGYGTTDERWRGKFGLLHEAIVVQAEPRALVDPSRTGSIGASACFGDSGGPVMRGGMLVGVITRAAHPSPRIACGHLTRWAPITASDKADVAVLADNAAPVMETHSRKARRHARRTWVSEAATVGLFNGWLTPKVEARLSIRRKQARQ